MPTPRVVEIRSGAINDLPRVLAACRIASRGRIAVAVGAGIGESVTLAMEDVLPGALVHTVVSGSMASARDLAATLGAITVDALVGVGGGGTTDVAKYAAGLAGIPFVSVATTLTHDGLASPVAVLDSDGKRDSFGTHPPIGVVVDLDFVAAGPLRHVRSGIGDAVSNLSAIHDWELAQMVLGEEIDGLAASMARSAAAAVLHDPNEITSPGFLRTLADGLVLSGIAMSVAGTSRPCSGGEHEISHAINALFPNDRLHGETVAVGTMFASYLRDDPELPAIDRVFRTRGLPRLPEDLGLDDARFAAAVLAAPATRPGRFTVLEHLDLESEDVARRIASFREDFS